MSSKKGSYRVISPFINNETGETISTGTVIEADVSYANRLKAAEVIDPEPLKASGKAGDEDAGVT